MKIEILDNLSVVLNNDNFNYLIGNIFDYTIFELDKNRIFYLVKWDGRYHLIPPECARIVENKDDIVIKWYTKNKK
jgi:hypothetical protein